jgi:hypothetical protein
VGCFGPRFGSVLVSGLRGLGFRSEALLAPAKVFRQSAQLNDLLALPRSLSRQGYIGVGIPGHLSRLTLNYLACGILPPINSMQ